MVPGLLNIDFITVLFAALVSLFLSLFWYSPLMMGCAWMVQMDLKGEDVDQMKRRLPVKTLGSFVCSYIAAVIMTVMLKVVGADNLVSGIYFGVMVAVGFVVTSILNDYFFENRSMKLFLINAGHYLVTYAAMGAILGQWS